MHRLVFSTLKRFCTPLTSSQSNNLKLASEVRSFRVSFPACDSAQSYNEKKIEDGLSTGERREEGKKSITERLLQLSQEPPEEFIPTQCMEETERQRWDRYQNSFPDQKLRTRRGNPRRPRQNEGEFYGSRFGNPKVSFNDPELKYIRKREYHTLIRACPLQEKENVTESLLDAFNRVLRLTEPRAEMASLIGMHKKGGPPKRRPVKRPLDGRPHMKGVIIRTLIKNPKKPNSANRKCVLLRLSNGKEMVAYVPGEGHNLQEHNIVLVKVGRLRDTPGVLVKCVRGKYDLPHVQKQK